MRKNQKHLRIDLFSQRDVFLSKRTARNVGIPRQDRRTHGEYIASEYAKALDEHDLREAPSVPSISPEEGVYIELTGYAGVPLPLASLDSTSSYKLKSVHVVSDSEVAVIFIPNSKRHTFAAKVQQYLNPNKDGVNGPRNHDLVDSIQGIRLADIKSFWTDASAKFPQDPDSLMWFELWLTDSNGSGLRDAQLFAERLELQIRPTVLRFHKIVVILVRASINQLELSVELMSCLEEIRLAKETPQVITKMNPREQREWAVNLQQRAVLDDRYSVSVAILDTGVNFNNPMLSIASRDEWSAGWNAEWSKYTDIPQQPYHSHGSLQAGIALFGNLLPVLSSNEPLTLSYRIESGRILPPSGDNDPDLYGAVTTGTASKLNLLFPNRRRVFSLAITATPEAIGGQPSSWSSELDSFAWSDGKSTQLIIVSAGNNRELEPRTSSWDQANLSQIEDPAQAWNAVTVGGYTELATNDDPSLVGWEPWCLPGDLAPATRTSVNWGWKKQAPFKPDLVAEAGNRLISPNQTELTDADCVSILTTSGRTASVLFDTTRDTSAATALISRYAAILMCEYPQYWAETIRALLVHSAAWTPRMLAKKRTLEEAYSKTRAVQLMLRTYGFGVPDLDRARFSADHLLTLVAQNEIKPYTQSSGPDAKLGEMHYYSLPWPADALKGLPPGTPVKLKVTLSYFVEPNPGRKGYRSRFSYQSHGLRFEVSRPGQSEENFKGFVNKLLETEDYDGPEGDLRGWSLGSQVRTRGSIHSDIWEGSAADLADMKQIAVIPVSGWWKYRASEGKWRQPIRYSLVVGIIVPDENLDVDIYSPVETEVNLVIEAATVTEVEV